MQRIVVRKIDGLGRTVIPVGLRRRLGIHPGDDLAFSVEGNSVVLTKHSRSCVSCASTEALLRYRSKALCLVCSAELDHLGTSPEPVNPARNITLDDEDEAILDEIWADLGRKHLPRLYRPDDRRA